MGKGSSTPAIEFLKALFQPHKGGLVELRAIPVEKNRSVIRHFTDRASELAEFAEKYGHRDSEYGVYFGVCKRREILKESTKDNVLGATALWCDIDAEVNGIRTEDILEAIGEMPASIQPSAVVHSGGGLHCYWFLHATSAKKELVEKVNRVLMDVMGGDACFDVSRVLRLPDTYNNKRAVKKLARVVYCAEHIRYDMDALSDALQKWGKVLHEGRWVKRSALPKPVEKDEAEAPMWFEKTLFKAGQRLPARLDHLWEHRVRDHAPRGYIGVHEATIVTAARLHCADYELEDIVRKVLEYQQKAPGVDSSRWDWSKEEHKIRKSLQTWNRKWTELKKRARAASRA